MNPTTGEKHKKAFIKEVHVLRPKGRKKEVGQGRTTKPHQEQGDPKTKLSPQINRCSTKGTGKGVGQRNPLSYSQQN